MVDKVFEVCGGLKLSHMCAPLLKTIGPLALAIILLINWEKLERYGKKNYWYANRVKLGCWLLMKTSQGFSSVDGVFCEVLLRCFKVHSFTSFPGQKDMKISVALFTKIYT